MFRSIPSHTLGVLFLFTSAAVSAQSRIEPGHVAQRIVEARRAGAAFVDAPLFSLEPRTPATDALWQAACSKADVVRYDEGAVADLLTTKPRYATLSVPSAQGVLLLDVELKDARDRDFRAIAASSGAAITVEEALHYRGMLRGDAFSVVAISLFKNEAMAIIGTAAGEHVIGRFDHGPSGLHVLYNEADLRASNNSACATPDEEGKVHDKGKPVSGATKSIRCVKWYWEAANDIYLNKGSNMTTTINYMTGLFNQVAVLYDNDGIDIELQELYVWDVASPYNGTSSSSRLSQFGTVRTSFNGDMAHLLDLGNYGGVAWLTTLCAGTSSRMAYSGINSSFSNVPTYSWSVEVASHEQGHNLGSRHTHACAWNGNNTSIDGCGPTAGYTEGSCATGPLPTGTGGTVMSYCHLVGSVGINFANGFGPQPRAVILNNVNAATCLLACGTTCDAPGLFVSILTPVSATLNWGNLGVVSYDLRWKPQASGTWTDVTGLTTTNYALSGLTQSTAYEYQVRSNCTSGTSAYSTSLVFTTPVPCPEAYEPNNTFATAAAVTLPVSLSALIAANGDQDHYGFTIAQAGTINMSLSGMPGDYDLYLLNSSGTTVASSTAGGTSAEYISYSAAAGSYVARVVGWNGAFSAYTCYTLNIMRYDPPCAVAGLAASDLTYNGATISWSPLISAASYDLQWKPASSSTWTTVTGLTGSSYALTGLAYSTAHNCRIKANCAGSQSGYGEPISFTTNDPPCEVVPPILLAGKAFLEGPYNTGTGIMSDGLRALGLVPTTEPYTTAGLAVTGPTTITAPVLAVTGPNAIVDWVAVELRNSATPATVVERRAALLQRDGDIVALDGTSALGFCSTPGTYHVAIRHRNHFACMTATAVPLAGAATTIDFASAAQGTYGTEARKPVGGVQVLWAGNALADAVLQYVGGGNDRDPILIAVGSTTPNNTLNGYLGTDVNMDGTAKYLGADNDRDPILINVGNTTPNNTRSQQLP